MHHRVCADHAGAERHREREPRILGGDVIAITRIATAGQIVEVHRHGAIAEIASRDASPFRDGRRRGIAHLVPKVVELGACRERCHGKRNGNEEDGADRRVDHDVSPNDVEQHVS